MLTSRNRKTPAMRIAVVALLTCGVLLNVPGAGPVRAGEPIRVGSATFGVAGQPILWPSGGAGITYTVDGGLLGIDSNAATTARVDAMFAIWTAVPTATVSLVNSGPIGTGGGCVSADGNVDTVAEFNCLGFTGNPIIYDDAGAITDSLFGPGNSVLGFAGPQFSGMPGSASIVAGRAVLNGRFRDGNGANGESSDTELEATILHEFGHFLGLGHSQVNVNCLTGVSCANFSDDTIGLPTMFPVGISGLQESPGVDPGRTLSADDLAIVSMLYPETVNNPPNQIPFNSIYGTISGRVLVADMLSAIQGANLIARQQDDPMTGVNESRRCAISVVSGFRYTGNPGLGSFTDAAGNPLNPGSPLPQGSRDGTLYGAFDAALPGAAVGNCSAATVGTYAGTVESIDPSFTGPSSVGPLGRSFPGGAGEQIAVPVPGGTQILSGTVTITPGGSFPGNDINLIGTPATFDAFDGPGGFANDTPATASPVGNGTFAGSISPMSTADPAVADVDVYRFGAIANQMVSIEVFAKRLANPSPLDSVIEIVDVGGTRMNLCRATLGSGPFTSPCVNDDINPGVIRDSKLEFQSGSPGNFFVRVFDLRGDARADFLYDITLTGATGNTPDLTINKSHTGNFTVGMNGTYSIVVNNVGTGASTGTITVTDTLPAQEAFVSATGTGWTCGAVAQVVTCTSSGTIPMGASSSTITLTVNPTMAAAMVNNTATVSGGGETNLGNDTAMDPTTINAAAVTRTFDNGGGGNTWEDPLNWNPDGVPAAGDDVVIGPAFNVTKSATAGTDTVNNVTVDGQLNIAGSSLTVNGTLTVNSPLNINGGTLIANSSGTVSTLNLSSGTLGGTGNVMVTGAASWTGGTMGGGGGTLAIASGATLTISGSGQEFRGHTINNAGTITWTSGDIGNRLGSSAINNQSGGVFNAQNNSGFFNFGAGVTITFTNQLGGTFTKSGAGTTTSFTQGPFNNAGTVNVNSGTLTLGNGGTSGGSFSVASGGTLAFSGGTHDLTAGSSVSGAGAVNFSGGAANIAGSYAVTGTTNINGGGANFNAAASTTMLNLSTGSLGGTGTLTVSGAINWTGGTMGGGGGTLAIASGATLTISGSGQEFRGHTINNAGTITWTSGDIGNRSGSSAINNQSGGVFNAQNNSGFFNFGAGVTITFTNQAGGTFTKSGAGTTTSFTQGPFNNAGTVNVNSGTLTLGNGGSSSGSFSVASGGTLEFSGGTTHDLTAASSVSGNGNVTFSGGAANIAGSYALTGSTTIDPGTANFNAAASTGSLILRNGTLGGTGTLTVSGASSWTSGAMTGGGTLAMTSLSTLTINGGVEFNNHTLNNAGTITWTAGDINIRTGANAINNQSGGVFNAQNNSGFGNFGIGGTLTFTNQSGATFTKSGAGTTSVFAVNFNNAGTLNVTSGTLSFTSSFTQTAGSTTLNGGAVSTNTTLTINGGTLGGNGTITGNVNNTGAMVNPGLTPGTLTITGNYTQGATGSLNIELGGFTPGTQFDVLAISGSATLAGTLNVQPFMAFVPSGSFQIMTFGSRVNDFTTKNNATAGTGFTTTPGATNYVVSFAVAACNINAAATGDWAAAATWSPATVPGAGDNPCIGGAFAVTVTTAQSANSLTVTSSQPFALSSGSLDLASTSSIGAGGFNQSGGTLSGAGSLTISGPFNWIGGTQIGAGATIANGGVNIPTNGVTLNNGRTLTNAGSGTFANSLLMGNGAVFTNSGALSLTCNNCPIGDSIGGTDTFNNSGTLAVSSTGSATIQSTNFSNTGSVSVSTGILQLNSSTTTSSGPMSVSGGATLSFGGTANLNSGTAVSGAGMTSISGTVNFNAGSSLTTALTLTGTVTFTTGALVTLPSLTQSTGTLAGTDNVNITAPFTWSGGTHTGSAQTNPLGGLSITGGVNLNNGRVLNNTVPGTMSGSGSLFMGNGAVFNNPSTFTATCTGCRLGDFIGGTDTFNNSGTLTMSGPTTLTIQSTNFSNTGSVSVTTGTLQVNSSTTTSSGPFNVGGGATLSFGGTANLNSGTAVTGAGSTSIVSTVNFNAGSSLTTALTLTGTVTFTTGALVTLPSLTQSTGTLAGTDNVNITAPFTWSGGTHTGSAQTNPLGGLSITGGVNLNNGRVLNNTVPGTMSGSGSLFMGNGAVFNNSSTFTATCTGCRLGDSIGGTDTFNNSGTLTMSGPTTLTIQSTNFNNTGTVTISSGTLQLNSSTTTSSGPMSVSGGATLSFGGTANLNSGTAVSGAGMTSIGGTVNFNAGSSLTTALTLTGTVTFTTGALVTLPSLTQSTGTLAGTDNVNITAPFTWSGGTHTGSAQTNPLGGLSITGGVVLNNGRVLNNTVPGTMSGSGELFMGNGAVFNNSSTFTATCTGCRLGDSIGGTDTFNNSGTLTMSGPTTLTIQSTNFNNTGTVSVTNGTLQLNTSGASPGNFSIAGGATLLFNSGTFTLGSPAGSMITATGTLAFGSINLNLNGILNIAGAFNFPAGANLNVDLNGLTPGTQFDQVNVTGTATLNGVLNITTGFSPNAGDSFKILTYGSRTGMFSAINGLNLGGNKSLQPNFNPNDLTLLTVQTITADLSVMKTGSPNPVLVGSNLTYAITVANRGPDGTTNATLTDTLPANVTFVSAVPSQGGPCTQAAGVVTCPLGSINNAAMATASIIVTPQAAAAPSVTNTASVSTTDTDPNAGNNMATIMTTVTPVADLMLTKTDSPDPVDVNASLTYTLTVSNAGPNTATNVVVTDTLPAGVVFVSAAGSAGVTCMGTTTVTCNLASLASGAMATVTIVIRPAAANAPSVTNMATVSATEFDPAAANNMISIMTTVTPIADLAITKVGAPSPVTSGSNITYTITVTNNGPSTAQNVMVTDTPPASLTFVSAAGSAGVTCMGTTTVTCTLASLASGAMATATVIVTATAAAVPSVNNTATVTSSTADRVAANNSATAMTTVNAGAATDFTITNNGPVVSVPAGQTAMATIILTPVGGAFNTAIALTCISFPPLGPCTLMPTSVTPGANPATSALSVVTFAALPAPPLTPRDLLPLYVLALGLSTAGMLLTFLLSQKPRRQRLQYCASLGLALLLATLMMSQAACSTVSLSLRGPYSVTVTGTSGAISHSTIVTVNVQ